MNLHIIKKNEPFANAMIISGINNTSGVTTTLNNLAKSSIYRVYIRTICASSGTNTGWSAVKGFRTAGPLYVNASATGNNDGTSWSNGFTNLQSAFSSVSNNGEIWIAKGTYIPHITDKERNFKVNRRNLKIYGGFAGTENNLGDRVRGANETILSGDLNNNDINTASYSSNYSNTTRLENSRHIINITSGGENLLLDGLTISDAHNSGKP